VRSLFTRSCVCGHAHPMIPLGLAAIEDGEEVLWATGPDPAEWVSPAGAPPHRRARLRHGGNVITRGYVFADRHGDSTCRVVDPDLKERN
jgi:hypothetical protein